MNGREIFSASIALNEFLDQAYAALKIDYPKYYKMDNLSKLGLLASELLLREKTLSDKTSFENAAVILSNAHSSLDTDTRYLESSKTIASPALFVYTLPNIVAGEICIRNKIKGENIFFVSSKFDSMLLTQYVSLITSDTADNINAKVNICLAGWIDVMGEQHDLFLYLFEKDKQGWQHHPEQLKDLYNPALWNN